MSSTAMKKNISFDVQPMRKMCMPDMAPMMAGEGKL